MDSPTGAAKKSSQPDAIEESTELNANDTMIEDPQDDLNTHDFTACCQSLNVSQTCMGFCVVHNILDGTAGADPEVCEKDFPNVVKCMADGRNHLPCCEQAKVPDLCQVSCLPFLFLFEPECHPNFLLHRICAMVNTLLIQTLPSPGYIVSTTLYQQ